MNEVTSEMIHDFINSRDIREHLEKIRYDFSLLEQVYIIRQSKYKSLKEKQSAYKNILSSTDDIILSADGSRRWKNTQFHGVRVHKILEDYTSVLDQYVDQFYTVGSDEYCAISYYYDSAKKHDYYDKLTQEDGNIFKSVHEAYEHALNNTKDSEDGDSKITGFVIYKNQFKHPKSRYPESARGIFDANGKLIKLEPDCTDYIEEFFDKLWFDIPIPFKEGDIVKSCFCNWGGTNEPFILMDTNPWMRKENSIKTGKTCEGCDSSDMNASGWSTGFYSDNPAQINDDVMADYMDLEYYRGDYKGSQRLLPLLAKQISGEIDGWTYTYAYRQIVAEYVREKARNDIGDYMLNTEPLKSILDGCNNGNNK